LTSSGVTRGIRSCRNTEVNTSCYRPPDVTNDMNEMLYFDFVSFLSGDVVAKVDRVSMASGLQSLTYHRNTSPSGSVTQALPITIE